MSNKNKLPFDIRKIYNQSVDVYQKITLYELDIISEQEFIKEVKNIVDEYEKIKESDPLLPPFKPT